MPLSIVYNGATYYYILSLQGDVVAILDSAGVSVVEYTYDAWGRLLSTTGSMSGTLGLHNPLRYRGYVYDYETGLYYLQSRYYNPQFCRFLSADTFVSTGQGILGYNMFAYCNNNPVNLIDSSGALPKFSPEFIKENGEWVDTAIGMLLYVTEFNRKGYLYEYWVELEGKIRWSRHHTNHGNSKNHPVVPHDHEWHDDDDGNNTPNSKWQPPNPGFKAPGSDDNSTKMISGAVGFLVITYVSYVSERWNLWLLQG